MGRSHTRPPHRALPVPGSATTPTRREYAAPSPTGGEGNARVVARGTLAGVRPSRGSRGGQTYRGDLGSFYFGLSGPLQLVLQNSQFLAGFRVGR